MPRHLIILLPLFTLLAGCVSNAPRDRPPPRPETEYERGYRQGAEAARPIIVPGPISVVRASYGSWSHNCDATSLVARRASGRYRFQMPVTNEMCGDPHQGKSKSLDVSYYCGNQAKTASAREHDSLTLTCP